MKKILITAALPGELKIAKKYYKENLYPHLEIHFLELGIGIHKTILSLTQELSKESYDFIVNFGVCGYIDAKKTCIQIGRSVCVSNQKEMVIPIFFKHSVIRSILCSEIPVFDATILGDLQYVDMESYAIEMVCENYKVGRIILKVPIDKVGEETHNFDKKIALESLKQNINFQSLTDSLISHMKTLPIIQSPLEFSSYYNFTFSEKIIFKKYFYAYDSLSEKKDTFQKFFESHKHFTKKEFLSELSQHISSLKIR